MSPPLTRVVVGAAERMAAAGRYEEAAGALAALGDGPEPAETLVLRARMLAQQGRYPESAAYWRAALQAEPGHEAAARGLALVEAMAAGRMHPARLRAPAGRWAALALAAGVVAAVAFWAGRQWRHPVDQTLLNLVDRHRAEAHAGAARGDRAEFELAALRGRLADQERAAARAMTALSERVGRLEQSLAPPPKAAPRIGETPGEVFTP